MKKRPCPGGAVPLTEEENAVNSALMSVDRYYVSAHIFRFKCV